MRERYGLDGAARRALRGRQAPAQEPGAAGPRAAPAARRTCGVVLAGHPEAYDAELRGAGGRARAWPTACVFADYVPDADLEALWALAGVRGVPDARRRASACRCVEALARGVPVACSDIPVLREVGGGLPRYLRARRPGRRRRAAIAAALDDGADAPRPGRAWAARFTWEAAAARDLRRPTSAR